ncbi:hypothetical protein EKO27_g1789 [Xylaria grammica]|uniref:Uncharacterized protein n=1 Tax=Xylaria grammica TaxID=363999 RepID=A0A439DG26_9PEZI|nr:hypothetical protein EKO27_g1789 [Xylaria grammica]
MPGTEYKPAGKASASTTVAYTGDFAQPSTTTIVTAITTTITTAATGSVTTTTTTQSTTESTPAAASVTTTNHGDAPESDDSTNDSEYPSPGPPHRLLPVRNGKSDAGQQIRDERIQRVQIAFYQAITQGTRIG